MGRMPGRPPGQRSTGCPADARSQRSQGKPLKSMLDPLLRRTEGRSEDPGHSLMRSEFGLGCSPFTAGPDSSRFVENYSRRTTRYWRRRPKWAQVTAFLNDSFMSRQAGIVGWHLDRLERARPNRRLAARIGSRASAARRRAQHTSGSSTTRSASAGICVPRRAGGTRWPGPPRPETVRPVAPDVQHRKPHTESASPPAGSTAFQESLNRCCTPVSVSICLSPVPRWRSARRAHDDAPADSSLGIVLGGGTIL